MSLASLILGILALLFSFIPIIGLPATVILGLLSIILGVIAMFGTEKDKQDKGKAIAGLIISPVAIILSVSIVIFFFSTGEKIAEDTDESLPDNQSSNVLTAFNVDEASESFKVVAVDTPEDYSYIPTMPDTCKYIITTKSVTQSELGTSYELKDYEEAVILNQFNAYVLSRGCGQWRLTEKTQ